MRGGTFQDVRFWLVAPVAAFVILIFGLYFWGLRKGFGGSWVKYPWALFVGLPMAIGNIGWNVIFASFVFMRPPVWKNESGEFSPFFTTRLKAYRLAGSSRLVDYFIGAIQIFDPDHFGGK